MLLALQTLKKLEPTVDHFGRRIDAENALASVFLIWVGFQPCDISKLNSSVHLRIFFVFSPACSPPSGIEVLETRITWFNVKDRHGKDLFSSDAGWSTLGELFTSQRFVSARLFCAWGGASPAPPTHAAIRQKFDSSTR